MAAAKPSPSGPSPWFVLAVAAAAAAFISAKQWPGVAALLAGMLIVGFTARPAQMTGPKRDGQPTPASTGERRQMARFQGWSSFKTGVLPGKLWLPGKPRVDWVFAVVAAAAAFTIPQMAGWKAAVGNAVAAFAAVVAGANGWRKSRAADDEPEPVSVRDLQNAPRWVWPVAAVIAAAAAVAGMWFGLPVILVAAVSSAAGLAAPTVAAVRKTMEPWWRLQDRRREVTGWWEATMGATAGLPRLLSTCDVGDCTVDLYEHRAGAQSIFDRRGVDAGFDAGFRYAFLHVPAEGQSGPIPGTVHSQRFEVACWPVGDLPDLSAVYDQDVAELLIRCIAVWAWAPNQQRPPFLGADLASLPPSDLSAGPGNEPDPLDDDDDGLDVGHSAPVDSPALWRADFAGVDWLLLDVNGFAGAGAGNAVVDHRNGGIYCGAHIDDVQLADIDWFGRTADQYADDLADLTMWHKAWAAALDRPELHRPAYYPEMKRTAAFTTAAGRKGTITFGLFARNKGASGDWREFTGVEPKLRNTLANQLATFAARLYYIDPKTRVPSPTYFGIAWSQDPVPTVTDLSPDSDRSAADWIITGHLNLAFDAVKLARPEVLSVQPLSKPTRGKASLWRIELRMHEGVTVTDVKRREDSLSTILRCKYMRFVEHGDSELTLVVGAPPWEVVLANPTRDRFSLASLDWAKAWSAAGVVAPGTNVTPKLETLEDHPTMKDVLVARFTIPVGLSLPAIRDQKVVDKLVAFFGAPYLRIMAVAGSQATFEVAYANTEWVDPLGELPPIEFGTGHVNLGKGPQIGWTETGDPWFWPVYGVHTVAAAASGHGKGSWLWGIIRGLEQHIADGSVIVWGIDLKGGVEMMLGDNAFARIAVNYEEGLELLADACRLLDARLDDMKGGSRSIDPSPETPMYLILFDEMASLNYMAPGDKERKAAGRMLSSILSRGRAAAVNAHGFLQDPSKESLRQRDLFTRRVGGRLDNGDMIDRLLGDGARAAGAACDKIPKDAKGVAYVTTDKQVEPVRVRAPFTTDAEIAAMNERLAGKVKKWVAPLSDPDLMWDAPDDTFISSPSPLPPPPYGAVPAPLPAPTGVLLPAPTGVDPQGTPFTLDDLDF